MKKYETIQKTEKKDRRIEADRTCRKRKLKSITFQIYFKKSSFETCGSPPGVMMADTLSFNAKIGVVDF